MSDHLQKNWEEIRTKLDRGSYVPSPVKGIEIPKPNGGVRQLDNPTVVDRPIQQAVHQKLRPIFELTFSTHSYGFRSAHDAVKAAREYIETGYTVR